MRFCLKARVPELLIAVLLPSLLLLYGAACSPSAGGAMDLGAGADLRCDAGKIIEDVFFPSTDGLMVHATATRPCGSAPGPWVVLAHQLCRDGSEWSVAGHDWVSAFVEREVATLAIDLRGHGASMTWPDGSNHDLCAGASDPDVLPLYIGMVGDVQAAIAYARSSLKATAVAVIGASIGSNSAIVAFSRDPQTTMVVALSPGLDYKGIQTSDPISSVGSRPVLLEAAEDDPGSAASVRQLAMVNASVTTLIWPTGGHANRIIDAHPDELSRVAALVASLLSPR